MHFDRIPMFVGKDPQIFQYQLHTLSVESIIVKNSLYGYGFWLNMINAPLAMATLLFHPTFSVNHGMFPSFPGSAQ